MAKSPNPYPLRKKPYPPSRDPMREPYRNDDVGGQSVTVRHSPTEFRGGHTHLRGSVWCPRNLTTLRRAPVADEPTSYVLGHTDHERRRLALQATVLNPLTDGF